MQRAATGRADTDKGEAARKKLIRAGLKIFSEVGYEGASTRSLAAAAEVNIAAIPYYFGNKEGLYLAVVDHIADYYNESLGQALAAMRGALEDTKTPRAACRGLLDDFVRRLIRFGLQEGRERSWMSRIYSREQLDPTAGFDRLYAGFTRGLYETLAALVGRLLGRDKAAPEVKIVAQTLIGQVAVFRHSRETVLHDMGWKDYGEAGLAAVERVVLRNVDAILRAHAEAQP